MTELDTLRARLASRERVPGYEKNVRAIKARIAELEKSDGKPPEA